MAEQRLDQRKGLMTQMRRRAQQTSQVLICHLPPPPQFLLLLFGAALAWELTGRVVPRSLLAQRCSLCIASPPV